MEDMIIKNTGNSRFLKSVANILTLYPSYEAFAAALAAGTFPVDLNGINPSGVEQEGTKLNKANLLSDATAAALGNPATPSDALRVVPPVGSIFWFGSVNPPAGFLKCDGAAVSRTDYAKLFAAIGTTFGSGDGSTTFLLPNLRGAFVRGTGSQNGYSGPSLGGNQNATYISYKTSGWPLLKGVGFYDKVGSYEDSGSGGFAGSTDYSPIKDFYVRPFNIGLTPIIKY